MDIAEIKNAVRRRDVSFAAKAGFDAEEIADIMECEISDVLQDLAWLAERKKDRLSEDRELSEEIAAEVVQLEDDEAMMRRWLASTANLGLRVKIMDRIDKVRKLRLELLGAFDRKDAKVQSLTLVEVGFDGRVKGIESGEIIDVDAEIQPEA